MRNEDVHTVWKARYDQRDESFWAMAAVATRGSYQVLFHAHGSLVDRWRMGTRSLPGGSNRRGWGSGCPLSAPRSVRDPCKSPGMGCSRSPSRAVTRFVAIAGMETRRASLGFSPRYLVPSTRA